MPAPMWTKPNSRSAVMIAVLAASLSFLYCFNLSICDDSANITSDRSPVSVSTNENAGNPPLMSPLQFKVVDDADSTEFQDDDSEGEFIRTPAAINGKELHSESAISHYRQTILPNSLHQRGPPRIFPSA